MSGDEVHFSLDVMPGRCGIKMAVNPGQPTLVRFRAIRLRRWTTDQYSQWSGDFVYDGEPIALRWEAFEWK